MVNSQVLPIHFEDYGWDQFERLVFAYHARKYGYESLEWYGQVGSDLGRDIWGIEKEDSRPVCIACARYQRLTFKKAQEDIDKVVAGPFGLPNLFRIVAGGKVSSNMRDRIKAYGKEAGIETTEVWSGPEFEEYLRRDAETLLKRFCNGEAFPDASADLCLMAAIGEAKTDLARFELLARVFDRPAFKTPIYQESSLPHFKKAISDTIKALNTGHWQTREGIQLGRVPRKDEFEDEKARTHLKQCVQHLTKLRAAFDELYKKGELESPDFCELEECSWFMMSPRASKTLSRHRNAAIREALAACETFPIEELPLRWVDLLDEEDVSDE